MHKKKDWEMVEIISRGLNKKYNELDTLSVRPWRDA
jgi:hypothetical protein